jgi:hypothetical protein
MAMERPGFVNFITAFFGFFVLFVMGVIVTTFVYFNYFENDLAYDIVQDYEEKKIQSPNINKT